MRIDLRGARGVAVRLLCATAFVIVVTAIAQSTSSGAPLAGYPQVTISAPSAPVIAGVPYRSAISISPYTTTLGSAGPLGGCYRLVATGLPPGLSLRPNPVCVTNHAASISAFVGGTYSPASTVLTAVSVTVSAYRTGQSSSTTLLGSATFSLSVLPRSMSASAETRFANVSLSGISCPAVGDCWVIGTSSNPPIGASGGVVGREVGWVSVSGKTSQQHLRVPAGGAFLGQLTSVSPLNVRIVRTGIPENLVGLDCPSTLTCLLIATSNAGPARSYLLQMTGDGSSLTAATPALPASLSASYRAISCPGPDFCVVVGNLVTSSGTTAGFSEQIRPGALRPALGPVLKLSQVTGLGGVACPDTQTCIATGQDGSGPTGSGRILITHDAARNWASDQVVAPDPLCTPSATSACPTALQPWFQLVTAQLGFGSLDSIGCTAGVRYSCALVWTFWSAIADTTDGVHWHVGTVTGAPDNLGGGNYSSIGPDVSCPSEGHCFAVESPLVVCGPGFACTHTAILASIPRPDTEFAGSPLGDGWEWGIAGTGPPGQDQPSLVAISCATVTTCVAVGKWQPYAAKGWAAAFPLAVTPESPFKLASPATSSSESSIARWLATPAEAFANIGVVLASVAVAAGGVLFITFPAQLFNLTFQENYDEISSFFSRRKRKLASRLSWAAGRRGRGARRARPGPKEDGEAAPAAAPSEWSRLRSFGLVVIVGSLLDGLLDPAFGPNVATLESVASICLAILAGAAIAAWSTGAYHARTGGKGTKRHLNALPWGLVVAGICVLVSRLSNFEPGYLYGVVCGIAFDRKLTKKQESHIAAVTMASILFLCTVTFFVRAAVHGPASRPGASWFLVLLDDFLAAVVVSGLVGATISLFPLQFLPGHRIRAWSKRVWAGLFLLSIFCVVDFVARSPAANAQHSGFVPTVVLFVIFAGASIAFREYFTARWRKAHHVRIRGVAGLVKDLFSPHPGEGVLSVEQVGSVAVVEAEEPEKVGADSSSQPSAVHEGVEHDSS